MKTEEQIFKRAKFFHEDKEGLRQDFFGFQTGDLISFLPWEKAKIFFKKEDWPEFENNWKQEENTDERVLAIMKDYMSFAWGKCNNQRGLSAGRSINHFQAWLWLIGEDELSDEIANYSDYGRPQLTKICEKYGWPVEQGE